MSVRKECPFCGDIHAKPVRKGNKVFVECPGCGCRGPFYENLSGKSSIYSLNEAVARWDDRKGRAA